MIIIIEMANLIKLTWTSCITNGAKG